MYTGTGTRTDYEYDSQGRLWHVTAKELAGQTVDLTTTYLYDLAGNLHSVAQPDGLTTTYTYDDANRLTDEVVTDASSQSVFAQHYTLRADGLRSTDLETRYDASGNVFSQVQFAWQYDHDGRLTEEAETVLAGGSNAPSPYADDFTFDLNGNRTTERVYLGSHTPSNSPTDATVTYAYDKEVGSGVAATASRGPSAIAPSCGDAAIKPRTLMT